MAKSLYGFVLSLSLLAFPLFLAAQQSGSMDQSSGSSMNGNTVAATGCLKQGQEHGGYYLTDDNGKTWELTGKSLPHNVNHKVTITGTEIQSSNGKQSSRESKIGASEKSEAGGNQYADLHVDQLKVESQC